MAPFVHPKLPLATRLALCWGAPPSRLPFSASRQKPFPKRNGATGARIVPIRSASPARQPSKLSRSSPVMPPAASWDNSRSAIPTGLNHSAQGCAVRAGRANSATLGNRPTNFSTRNGLYQPPSKRMKPRWGKNHFTVTTRRRCLRTAHQRTNAGLNDEIPLGFSEPLPRSSNPNHLWPGLCRRPPWRKATHRVFAGERDRSDCLFRRRAANRSPN